MELKQKKQHPEYFITFLILLLGAALVLITPVGANYDEDTYMARIWEMGLGHFIPNSFLSKGANLPDGFISISYRRQGNIPTIRMEDIKKQMQQKIDWGNTVAVKTRAVYFPTLFAIQAVLIRIFGTFLNLPIAMLYYIIRLSYLLIYGLLVFFTIRLLPFGKWAFGVLTVTPMCLIQAASVSSDPMIFGIAFLFIAWIVKLSTNASENLSKKDLQITCILILAVGTLKPNTIFLLILLLIIPAHIFKKNKSWIPLLVATIASIGISLGWSYIASKYFIGRENSGVDSIANFFSILSNPLFFIKNLWFSVSSSFSAFYKQAVGVSGYGYWYMPNIVYWLFPASILLALFSEKTNVNLSIKQRLLFGLIGVVNLLMVFVIFFIVETPTGYHGIWGVQGRYFTLFFPLLVIPLMFKPRVQINKIITSTVLTFILLICVVSLFLSYHVVCGYAMATNQPCVLPYYKNWDTSTLLGIKLDKDTNITQTAVITCKELTGIQVWVNKNNTTAGQKAFFTLEAEEGNPIRTAWIEPDKLPQNGWATIAISPPLYALNSELQFSIFPKDGDGIPGLELGRFPTSEFGRGALWLNAKETENDLAFKYICADDFSTILK